MYMVSIHDMNKRGLGFFSILIVAVIALVIVITGAVIYFDSNRSESSEKEILIEDPESVENLEQDEITEDPDEKIQEDNETEIDDDENMIFDLEAIGLSLESGGCETVTNSTTNVSIKNCSMDITGTFRNSGSETIDEKFVVQFLDVTNGISPIEIITVDDVIVSKEEKNLSATYRGISPGTYFINFKVDAVRNIEESDEGNNEKNDVIKIP